MSAGSLWQFVATTIVSVAFTKHPFHLSVRGFRGSSIDYTSVSVCPKDAPLILKVLKVFVSLDAIASSEGDRTRKMTRLHKMDSRTPCSLLAVQ